MENKYRYIVIKVCEPNHDFENFVNSKDALELINNKSLFYFRVNFFRI